MITYEQKLSRSFDWALREGGRHFEYASEVHRTLIRLVTKLDELEIPYALVGAMALFAHGYQRFTQDVDLLVTRDALHRIHEELEGRGYRPPFAGSKQLRDTQSGVRIEFLVSGEYPGDGKPKPVVFPDPEHTAVDIEGVKVLDLPRLLELKLASGISSPGRQKDLGDVQEVIKSLALPLSFAEQLDESVRQKYVELWEGAQTEMGKLE